MSEDEGIWCDSKRILYLMKNMKPGERKSGMCGKPGFGYTVTIEKKDEDSYNLRVRAVLEGDLIRLHSDLVATDISLEEARAILYPYDLKENPENILSRLKQEGRLKVRRF